MRVLVVDDEPLVRERLRALLAAHPDVAVVGERGDGPSALQAGRELGPEGLEAYLETKSISLPVGFIPEGV